MATSSSTRTQGLWQLLLALFGIDAVGRKFGKDAPAAWPELLASLNDFQFARGMKRLPMTGKPHVPALTEFFRLCRDTGGVGEIEEPLIPAARQVEGPTFRPMQIRANLLLLNYIQAMTKLNSRRYAPDCDALGARASGNGSLVKWGSETARRTGCLLTMRNTWTEDMEQAERDGTMPADGGLKEWRECMQQAEKMIDSGYQCDAVGRPLRTQAA